MDWLNYHHLHYFWRVAREGSVSRAAEQLHLTQPTLTAQIRRLEKALGQKLFQKRGRLLVLTPEGEQVYRYADEIFGLGQQLIAAARGERSVSATRFAIGISDSLPKLTTYRLVEPAFTLQPPHQLYVRIDKTERLLAELAVYGLDVVIADVPMLPTLRVKAFNHLLGETTVTVFGVAALARSLQRNFPQSLDGAPMLLQTPNTAVRQSLDQWFAAKQMRPRIVGEVEDMTMLQTLAQHGHGAFIAPTVVRHEVCRRYHVQAIGELPQVRERFYAISVERKITHPAVRAIAEAARQRIFS
ncbi:MAG: LysR family transcriptional regulator [Pirellulales bacterium]